MPAGKTAGFLQMGILDFKKRFGQNIDPDEIKKNFVNGVNHSLIKALDEKIGNYYSNSNPLFDHICLGLNLNPNSIISNWNERNFDVMSNIPPLRKLTSDNFDKTLVVIELAYEFFHIGNDYRRTEWLKSIDKIVQESLIQILSLKIYWHDGKFYPEGAKALDEKLIGDNLTWLDKYPKVKALFSNALNHYSESLKDKIKRKDAISNSFQALEELTRIFLKNDKAWDKNYNELVDKLNLLKQWKNIFHYYKELSKEFGRHPGKEAEYIPTPEDTEAFLYLSGLLVRLIIEKMKHNQSR